MQSTLKGHQHPGASAQLPGVRTRYTRTLVLVCVTLSILGCAGDPEAGKNANSARGGANGEAAVQSTDRAAGRATSNLPGALNPSRASRARVVFLGTSLTAGLGLDPAQAYPTLLQRKADSAGFRIDIVNAGLSGETSAGALRRAGWVLDQPASAIVLEVGANDGLRGVNPDSTYANIVALVGQIRREQPEAKVLLVQMEAPTNLGRDYTARFHDAYVRAARDASVPLLPFLLDGVAGDASLNQSDGIHPNSTGSGVVANTMWSALRSTFAELDAALASSTTALPSKNGGGR